MKGGRIGRGDDCRNRNSLRKRCEGIVIFRTSRPPKYTHSSGATSQLSEPLYPSFSRILWLWCFPLHSENMLQKTTSRSSIVVQSLSCAQLFATPWTAARQASLSFTVT